MFHCLITRLTIFLYSKWKPTRNNESNHDAQYYLIKIQTFSVYWNPKHKSTDWNLPSQYYVWRNAMSSSLQNFSLYEEEFDFSKCVQEIISY